MSEEEDVYTTMGGAEEDGSEVIDDMTDSNISKARSSQEAISPASPIGARLSRSQTMNQQISPYRPNVPVSPLNDPRKRLYTPKTPKNPARRNHGSFDQTRGNFFSLWLLEFTVFC